MLHIIARRKELYVLKEHTNDFEDISNCKSFGDYRTLITKVMKQKIKNWKEKEIQGLVFGEPFCNFWLIDQGPSYDIDFVRISTVSEDIDEGIDCHIKSRNNGKQYIVNHKTYFGGTIGKEETSSLGWSSSADRPPVVITTAYEVSHRLQAVIQDRGGFWITGAEIENSTKNPGFWKKFAEYLGENLIEWKEREKIAYQAAVEKANMPLDNWQTRDLEKLKKYERGVIISPPGSGKTRLESKLIESLMDEEPGPVIVISRVKALMSQILEELVETNKHLPDRIIHYSDPSHDMDLKEPLAVGSVGGKDDRMENILLDCYKTSRNVIIGSIVDRNSVRLLKWLEKNKIPARIVVDELAEAISGTHRENILQEKEDKETTLNALYSLNKAGLIENLFGFDAVWKYGIYQGMDDHTLWGQSEPIVEHSQHEMTYERNVLCPVTVWAVEITEELLEEVKSSTSGNIKRQVELAANLAVMRHQINLVNEGQQDSAKVIAFSSSSEMARKVKAELSLSFGDVLGINDFVLAATTLEHRKEIQSMLASDEIKFGHISNYAIWIKGMNVPGLTACNIGYGRLPNEEYLTHIIGRITRRVPAERGMPLADIKIKPCGHLYVPYVTFNIDGGKDFAAIKKVYQSLYKQGIVEIQQKFIRASSSQKPGRRRPEPEIEEVDNSSIDSSIITIKKVIEDWKRDNELKSAITPKLRHKNYAF